MKFSDQIHQILNASSEPIKLPDDQGVAFTQSFLRLGEAGTFSATTADLVLEDLLAADLNQGFGLEFEVLVLAGDAGVSDQHALTPRCRNLLSKLMRCAAD